MRKLATISPLAVVLLMVACQKETANPFDREAAPVADVPMPLLPLENFAGLHQRIFSPTCAVSGCHDGSFEPDLRTIGSAYNTLVYHPVIGNDPTGSFTYRVMPGDHQASYLHERLVAFVPNTSGIMPLGLVEGSDWPTHQQTYVQAIRNWIANGAPDMFGVLPTQGMQQPQLLGLAVLPAGKSRPARVRSHLPANGALQVPAAPLELWLAFGDADAVLPDAVTVQYATEGDEAASTVRHALRVDEVSGTGFGSAAVRYTHRALLDLSGLPKESQVHFTVTLHQGEGRSPVMLPNEATDHAVRDLFTLRMVP
jgi:hypothetical protein